MTFLNLKKIPLLCACTWFAAAFSGFVFEFGQQSQGKEEDGVTDKWLLSQVKSLKTQAINQIRIDLETQLDQVLGANNQWVELKADFATNQYLRDQGAVSAKEELDLPGLGIKMSEVPTILKGDSQTLKSYVNAIKITIHTRNSPSAALQTAAKLALINGLSGTENSKISISFVAAPAAPAAPPSNEALGLRGVQDSLTKMSTNVLSIANEASAIQKGNVEKGKLDFIFSLVISAELGILALALIIESRKSKKGMSDRVAIALERISVAIGEQSQNAPVAAMSAPSPMLASPQALSGGLSGSGSASSSFHEGEEIMASIRAMLDRDPELALLAGYQLLQSGTFDEAFIFMGAVSPNLRSNISERAGPAVMNGFNEFIRTHGSSLMANSDDFHKRIQMLYQKLWPASQDRDSFIYTFLSEMLLKLDPILTSQLMGELIPNELSAYLSICGPAKFADALVKNSIKIEDCKGITGDSPSGKVIKSLFEKLTAILRRASETNESVDPIISVAQFLPQELEFLLLQMTGQSVVNSFNNLLETHFSDAVQWIARLDVNATAELMATFEAQTSLKVLAELPEIKARRIKSISVGITQNGLELKAKLQGFLKQIVAEPKDKDKDRVA